MWTRKPKPPRSYTWQEADLRLRHAAAIERVAREAFQDGRLAEPVYLKIVDGYRRAECEEREAAERYLDTFSAR